MRLKADDSSTTMSEEQIIEQLFPTQEKYRNITLDILKMFREKGQMVSGRSELAVHSVVSALEEKGHNRHTIYKCLRTYLVPFGLVNWRKYEGSIQLSHRFANALRRISISWKNIVDSYSKGN